MGISQRNEIHQSELNSIGKFGLKHRNNAGIRFSTYLETNSLVALTTYFQKNDYVTWTHPRSKLPHQIDHFITSKSFFKTDVPMLELRHPSLIVTTVLFFVKLRIHLNFSKRFTRRQRVARLDQKLLLKPRIKNMYCERVNNLYLESDDTDSYSKLERSMELAALTTLPKTIRPQPGWFASQSNSTKSSDGSKCVNAEENAEVFRDHFQKLYEREPIYDTTVIELLERQPVFEGVDHDPTDDEITKATQSLKNNAPGESGLTPLMFKSLIALPETFTILKQVVLEFWNTEKPPDQWNVGLLKVLPKKGDLSLPGNYRGIMLLEIAYKIVAKIVHQRLTPISESLDHETQCGFRPGRGCTDAILLLNLH
ncbi:uncharacterized protein [Clytia hemisphaerica]|uniref:uncharacterized protein n=1 Tax=Clytia hemisphaerica TaxID=252671 RepID=UPI0034D57995